MSLDSITLNNTLINREIIETRNTQPAMGAFHLIQQASRAVFSVLTPLASLKFCPRKKKSVCFSKDVSLNVFSHKSLVIENKTEYALRMSLEHDFLRPVQFNYHLGNLGYKVEESSISCTTGPEKVFEAMIQKY